MHLVGRFCGVVGRTGIRDRAPVVAVVVAEVGESDADALEQLGLCRCARDKDVEQGVEARGLPDVDANQAVIKDSLR